MINNFQIPQLSRKAIAFKKKLEAAASEQSKSTETTTDFQNTTATEARQQTQEFLAQWLKDQPALPKDIIIEEQQILIEKKHKVKLRIYRNKQQIGKKTCPGILYHTAGGLVNDMQIAQDYPCALLCQSSNAIVISIQPPLAPEHKHASILTIVNQTTQYLYDKALDFGIDKKAIAISGYSMGGNLALLSALQAIEIGLHIKAVVIISGQLDLSLASRKNTKFNHGCDLDFLAPIEMQQMFINFALEENDARTNPKFSPLFADLSHLPETLLIGGNVDALTADIRAMKEKYPQAELIEIPGAVHNAFFMWHHLGNEQAHMAMEIGKWLKKIFNT